MKKRILSMLLAIVMVVGLVPGVSLTAFAADGDTTTVEAKWGADADNLTESGSLEDAIAAATAADSTVKYIQLQSDVSLDDYIPISTGSFTIDLNGKEWKSSTWVLYIGGESEVTIDDTDTGGTLITEKSGYSAIALYDNAKLEIAGGRISAVSDAVDMSYSGRPTNAELTVSGGKLESTSYYPISASGNKVTISGGEITSGREDIYWKTGTIDLSGHKNPAGISFNCAKDNALMNDISLPDGYYIYDQNNPNAAVPNLDPGKTYRIGAVQTGGDGGDTTTAEAMWGADASNLTESGTLEQALAAAKEGTAAYIQLQSDVSLDKYIPISTGSFTIDLNGKEWKSSTWGLYIGGESEVKIDDTAPSGGGTLITEELGCPTILLYGSAKLEIADGTISSQDKAVDMSDSGQTTEAELTVSGGKLESTGNYAISASGNKVTISGGTIRSAVWALLWGNGTIDLSKYGNPEDIKFTLSTDTMPLNDITLPTGYCVYDQAKPDTAVTEFSGEVTTYRIGKAKYTVSVSANPTEGGTASGGGTYEEDASVTVTATANNGYKFKDWTKDGEQVSTDAEYTFTATADRTLVANFTKIEAKWGADASNLTESGTLEEAITAATAANSTVTYIQLQSKITLEDEIRVTSGKFTIDLYGNRWESSQTVLSIGGTSAVTITDTATDGTLITEKSGYSAIALYDNAKLQIAGGTISGRSYAVTMHNNGFSTNAELTVSGGKLISTGTTAIFAVGNKVTISGGEITSDEKDIYWETGTIDLSGHKNPTDISFKCAKDKAMDDITLPTGYYIYDQNNPDTAVTEFSGEVTTYRIGKAKYTITFDTDGGSEIDPITQEYGTTITAPAAPTKEGYTFTGWEPAIPETMPAGNVTVTAQWTEKATVSVDETVQPLIYDGSSKAFAITGTELTGFTVTYQQNGAEAAPINAGVYDVIITRAEDDTYKKFEMTIEGGLVIDKKPVTVSADDQEAYVGKRMPELTCTVSGLIGDDTISVELSCDADMNRAGDYPIVVSATDESGNYEITTVNGTLTMKYYPIVSPITKPTYPPVVDDDRNGDVTVSPAKPEKGDTVVITPDPDKGYEVDKVIVTDKNGKPVTVVDNGDGTYSFRQPDGKVNIEVTFTEINEITEITDVDEIETPEKLCTLDSTCPMYGYTDLDMTAWYHDGVHFCLENGLMNGIGADIFAPDMATSRAMIVTILWRLEGSPVVNYAMSFDDVAADAWYTEAVRWAASEGIVSGYSDEAFGPNDEITREQLATILYRYEQSNGGGFTGTWMIRMDYADLEDVSDWAYEAMCWMNMNSIVNGKPGKMLDPKGNATRAEAATMLYRYCEVMTKGDEN